ncbi:MAG: Na/Pi cotransporter family protein [Treponema sp.]|jgi:phosphate:Na+ symporter|nr:Na/Pi cotransporter family protein [Treponema sp.]
MNIIGMLLQIVGGLCLFLYGMQIMSDGVQQAAGNRLQRVLNFMTGNRFIAVITGFVVTVLIQSSSATTVMLVSFVNAGLLTLTQSIGVIMGSNIGTTTTAWIVSTIGIASFDMAQLAVPAIGIGFLMKVIKWKGQNWGAALMGFGFIFLGLTFLALPPEYAASLGSVMTKLSNLGFLSVLTGVGVSTVITLIVHSSAATITVVISLAIAGVINFPIAGGMILGANIGTTIDAILAAIGTKAAARQTALVHVLFNIIGAIIILCVFTPFLNLVDFITPGSLVSDANTPGSGHYYSLKEYLAPGNPVGALAFHLAMFHTIFNVTATLVFLPLVKPFAAVVRFFIKDDASEKIPEHYVLDVKSGTLRTTPELSIIQAEKEIRDMAGVASSMYAAFSTVLKTLKETEDKEKAVNTMIEDMKQKENYADEMREALTAFLIECTHEQLNPRSDRRVSQLLRIIADLEDMTDDCYSIGLLLERSVRKNQIFKEKEMEALVPYVDLVESFLALLQEQLGKTLTSEQIKQARELENKIDESRNKLRKLGRKRIEAGVDVKTELLFIDLVRRIEKVGDYCYSISESLTPRKSLLNFKGLLRRKDQ